MSKIVFTLKGGPKSGHHGHAGRPGSVGGSVPGTAGGAISAPTDSVFGHNQLKHINNKTYRKLIETTVKILPQEHLDMVGSITSNVRSSKDAGACDSGGYIDLMVARDGRRMWNKDTVKHEIGHAVLYHGAKYGDRPLKDFRDLYSDLAYSVGATTFQLEMRYRANERARPAKGFPTGYSQVSAHELFAESYSMYVAKPASLLKRSPDVYNYMRDKVFNGVEYLESK